MHDVEEAVRTSFPDADAQALLAAVERELIEGADADPHVVKGWCVHAARDLYRRMVEIGDFAGALRAVKLLSDLTNP